MAYLTMARIPGDPDSLLATYERTSEVMTEVGRDHQLTLHAVARTDEGLLILNLWRSEAGSHAAAGDPRRRDVIHQHGLRPAQIRYEHHEVTDYLLFD